jgi:hypothetical protein
VLRGEPMRVVGGSIRLMPGRRMPRARTHSRSRKSRSRRLRRAPSRSPGRLADDPDLAPRRRVLTRAA